MKRVLSILLALLFGVGPLATALPGSEDARLPACCRRNGAHHCAMAAQMARMAEAASDGRPALTAPATCPYYPGAVIAWIAPAHALLAPSAGFAVPQSSVRVALGASIAPRTAPARTHAGRGPPASIPS